MASRKRPRRDWVKVATDHQNARKMADEELAITLFAGDEHGNFPARNSREETKSRAAVARIIRDRMSGFSAELLALAIDPDAPSGAVGMTATRRIRFESLRRGRKPTWRRDVLVAGFIKNELGKTEKLEAAYLAAEKKFDISRATAQAIWKWHRRAMDKALQRETDASK